MIAYVLGSTVDHTGNGLPFNDFRTKLNETWRLRLMIYSHLIAYVERDWSVTHIAASFVQSANVHPESDGTEERSDRLISTTRCRDWLQ